MSVTAQPKVMTRWSRHDPVFLRGNADHWAKLRIMSAGDQPAFEVKDIADSKRQEKERQLSRSMMSGSSSRKNGDGVAEPVANAIASRVTYRDLHGGIPGNYASPNYAVYTSLSQPKKVSKSAQFTNKYHTHAKQGFEFWFKDRPKPTKYGSYCQGCAGSTLGLVAMHPTSSQ